jgi:hypothetical protein
MKRQVKKLRLTSETLRNLSPAPLSKVVGGDTGTTMTLESECYFCQETAASCWFCSGAAGGTCNSDPCTGIGNCHSGNAAGC